MAHLSFPELNKQITATNLEYSPSIHLGSIELVNVSGIISETSTFSEVDNLLEGLDPQNVVVLEKIKQKTPSDFCENCGSDLKSGLFSLFVSLTSPLL